MKKLLRSFLCCICLLQNLQAQNIRVGVYMNAMPVHIPIKIQNPHMQHPNFSQKTMYLSPTPTIFAEFQRYTWCLGVHFGYMANTLKTAIWKDSSVPAVSNKGNYVTARMESSLIVKKIIYKNLYVLGGVAISYFNSREGGFNFRGIGIDKLNVNYRSLAQNTIGAKVGFGYYCNIYKRWNFNVQAVSFQNNKTMAQIDYDYTIDRRNYQTQTTIKGIYYALQMGFYVNLK